MLTLRAAVYARYSSENQRPESIDDQVSSCKKQAAQRGFTVDESLIFPDEATSGARSDRKGLAALLAASEAKKFDVVLVVETGSFGGGKRTSRAATPFVRT